jgi:hypothetical protein
MITKIKAKKHKNISSCPLAKGVLFLLTITLLTGTAIAHENRKAGPYEINEIGWISEPPYAGLKNAVHFDVDMDMGGNMSTTHGVGGLENTLEVTLSTGGKTTKLRLRPVTEPEPGHEESGPGHYVADIVPTRPGTYTLTIKGTIETMGEKAQVNEIVTLEEIRSLSELQFPEADPMPSELQKSLDNVNSQMNWLSSSSKLWSAGMVTGILGLLIGIVALVVALRKK